MIRYCKLLSLGTALAWMAVGHVHAKNEPETGSKMDSQDIKVWIDDLDHPSFEKREAASRKLWEVGEKARSMLEELVDGKSPESAYRARQLLHKLDLFIRPDTNPELVKLIEEYQTASAVSRKSLFQKIRALRAWPQLLRLYAEEKDPYIRKTYASSMSAIAMQSAREEIIKGDDDKALEILKMAPRDTSGLNALAYFYWLRGTIQEEWKKAAETEGKDAAMWRLAMARAMGDLPAAMREAELADDRTTSAAMAALMGDPIPWLMSSGEFKRNEHNRILPLYLELARKRWLGQEIDDLVLRELSGKLSSNSTRIKGLAMNSLFLLNRTELAESALEKSSPVNAFNHYLALERIDEALAIMGLNEDVSKNGAWIDKLVGFLESNNLEDGFAGSRQSEQLVTYIGFLDSRGLVDEGFDLLAPRFMKLAKKHEEVFVGLISELLVKIGGAPTLGHRLASEWAGEDEGRWDQLRLAVFDADVNGEKWWRWMVKLDPKVSFDERMRGLLTLYRIGPDPKRMRESWMQRAWKHIDDQGEGAGELLAIVSQLEATVGHVEGSLRAWDALPDDQKDIVYWVQRMMHLSAADRWGDAADTILKIMDDSAKSGRVAPAELHAYAASALRKAKRNQEAQKHDRLAEKLSLGQTETMMRVANGYAYGLDYERANIWWERMLIFAEANDEDFASFSLIYGESLIHQGEWSKAASIMEVVTASHAESNYGLPFPLSYMHQRLKADVCRALSRLPEDREASVELLRDTHQRYMTDGVLADFFYPALRQEGLVKYHDEWFEKTWSHFEKSLQKYPRAHNTCNTAAWFGSRAQRQLEKSEKYLKSALDEYPYQPAYLDTMAEIQFAKGDRKSALTWSKRSINYEPDQAELRRQHYHFLADPMPK